jgi:hypothetical protein
MAGAVSACLNQGEEIELLPDRGTASQLNAESSFKAVPAMTSRIGRTMSGQ